MSAVRQDAWSAEDDLILAEVTLRHIREATQLVAFEEVGERIGRTSAACGFRWNSAFARNMRMLSAWRNLSVKEVIIKTAFGKRTAGCRFGRSGTGARCL